MRLVHKNFLLLIVALSLIACGSALASNEDDPYEIITCSTLQNLAGSGLDSQTVSDLQTQPENFTQTRKVSFSIQFTPHASVHPEETLSRFSEEVKRQQEYPLASYLLFKARANGEIYWGMGFFRGGGETQAAIHNLRTAINNLNPVGSLSAELTVRDPSGEVNEELLEFVYKFAS